MNSPKKTYLNESFNFFERQKDKESPPPLFHSPMPAVTLAGGHRARNASCPPQRGRDHLQHRLLPPTVYLGRQLDWGWSWELNPCSSCPTFLTGILTIHPKLSLKSQDPFWQSIHSIDNISIK